jgi:hypothetical protein
MDEYVLEGHCACGWTNEYRTLVASDSALITCPTCQRPCRCTFVRKQPVERVLRTYA